MFRNARSAAAALLWPAHADFDCHLQKWNGYNGSGSCSFWLQRP